MEVDITIEASPELVAQLVNCRLIEMRPHESVTGDHVAKATRRLLQIVEARIAMPEIRSAHMALCTREVLAAGMARREAEREAQRQAEAERWLAPPSLPPAISGLDQVQAAYDARLAKEAERGSA